MGMETISSLLYIILKLSLPRKATKRINSGGIGLVSYKMFIEVERAVLSKIEGTVYYKNLCV